VIASLVEFGAPVEFVFEYALGFAFGVR